MFRFRSVLARTITLHLVAIVVTSLCMPLALYLMLRHAADDLHERALREQADEILHYIAVQPDGSLRLQMPAPLVELYSEAYGRYAYAVIDQAGKVEFSSLSGNRAISEAKPGGKEAAYFSRRDGAPLYGVSLPAELAGRRLWVQVTQDLAHRDVLIDDIVADFFSRVGWITAPILLLLLAIDVVIFRRALHPIVAASALAARIGPRRTDLRLPEDRMPQEVLPLVRAVNEALDRLEEGFRGQREFTADAAHELRTPLTILRTQIDMIADRELAGSLRKDVEGMSRLVNQLLDMAELETFVIGPEETAELGLVAADVAAFLAPLALAQDRTVEVVGRGRPVHIAGNADAIARAIRNLVENALAHTPSGTAVEIAVGAGGTITVSDQGTGIPAAHRDHIFRRFWRRDRRRQGSAGLGLSIVARIAQMHGGTIAVGDRTGGGASFTLSLPVVRAPAPPAREEIARAA